MTDDLQMRISAYLNGDLTDEDADRLRYQLSSDPKALTEFVHAMDQHAELRKAFQEGKGTTQALKEIRQANRFKMRSFVGAIAACAAIAAVVFFFWPGSPAAGSKALARLESLKGRVVRIAAGRPPESMSAGDQIAAGQGVETDGDSRATLRLPDGTSLELGSGTKIQDFAQDGENRIVLSKGELTADVTRQPSDRPLVFVTAHGEAKILGTVLKLSVDPDPEKGSTRLEVTHGRVRLTRRHIGDYAEVAAGHFAVVARELAPESKTLSAELVRRMAPNSWLSLPGTKLRQAVPDPAGNPKIQSLRDPRGIVDSWSGGVLDSRRNRLVVWGGGHTNYAGNELYAFDLETLQWERLTDPTLDPAVAGQVNKDGTPVARATYNGLACITHADRMFALGGDPAPGAGVLDFTWTFDFASKTWENRNPSGDRPSSWVGCACAYDPGTRKIWWGENPSPAGGTGGFYSYDFDANRWTKHSSDLFYYQTMAVDTRRGRLVAVGNGKLLACDVRGGGSPVLQPWTTTGGEALIAKPNPGFDYDAAADRLVGWAGGIVYALNPETKTWEAFDPPASPKPTRPGIFGRWRYVPSLDVFVVVTAIDENVHFYRLPAGK